MSCVRKGCFVLGAVGCICKGGIYGVGVHIDNAHIDMRSCLYWIMDR